MLRSLILLLMILAAPGVALAQQPRYGGELIFIIPIEAPSYDGHREGTFGLIHPVAPHYNTLLRTDPNDSTGVKVIGDLAESWTVSKTDAPIRSSFARA